MNSFYGGKQGRTYHIAARYDCLNIVSFINEYKILYDEEQIESIESIPEFDIRLLILLEKFLKIKKILEQFFIL